MNVHLLICEHMHKISRLMLSHISPSTSVQEYISDSRMNVSTVWGSNREIYTFANMCQVNVYDMHRRSWSVYSPNLASDVLNVDCTIRSVYLRHPRDHYDVVVRI